MSKTSRIAMTFLLTVLLVYMGTWPNEVAGQAKPKPKKPTTVQPNAALTKENYEKIHVGMTFAEVRAFLGTRYLGLKSKNMLTATWHRLDKSDPEHIVVAFVDDKVVSKSHTMKWPVEVVEKPKAGLTRENYLRIKVGETRRDDVVAMFGKPKFTENVSTKQHYHWKEGATEVRVVFERNSGLVTTKSNKQGWPNDEKTVLAEAAKERKAKLDTVELGMSEDEVTKRMGAPTQTERAGGGRSGMLWQDGDDFALVLFRDKKAVAKDASLIPPTSKAITRALFERVRKGMTRADLIALLGEPTEENGDMLTWRQGKRHIWVRFTGGGDKVTVRSSSEDQTPLLVFEKTAGELLDQALADLKTPDPRKRRAAIGQLEASPYLEDRADSVARIAQTLSTDRDMGTRQAGLRLLRRWATKEVVAASRSVLAKPGTGKIDDPNRDRRPGAIAVVVKLREPSAVSSLCMLLHSFFDRSDAEKALLDLGPDAAGKDLLKHRNSVKDLNVRLKCDEILKAYKADPDIALSRTLALFNKGLDPEDRAIGLARLMHFRVDEKRREEVAKSLEGLLGDGSLFTAHLAATLLGKWGTPANEPALLESLSTAANREMKLALCRSLGDLGTIKSVMVLKPFAADFDGELARVAEKSIAAIESRDR